MKFEARVVGRAKIREDRRVFLDHAHLVGADFSGRRLDSFGAYGSRLEKCRFDKSRIDSASFGEGKEVSEYVDCSFDGARFCPGPGGYYRFVRCSFKNVNIYDWFCFAVELVDCTFSGKMRGAVFNGTPHDEIGRAHV